MHIVDFPNPPNDTKRSFGIWSKLLIGFWPIMSCRSFESSQTSMKGMKSFVKKTFQVFRFQCTLNIYNELHMASASHGAFLIGITRHAQ